MDVRIRNTARDSQLHRFGVFEYVPLQEALGVPALQAIAVPLTAGELPLLLDNLALWNTPAFRPLRPDSPLCGKVDLRLFFDVDPSDEILEQVQAAWRSEEHTSELQSLMRISYAVFCLKKKTTHDNT